MYFGRDNVTLWVSVNGMPLLAKLGLKPIAYLSYVKDENDEMVSGYKLREQDALAVVELVAEHNALPCNDLSVITVCID